MCGRYTQTASLKDLRERFQITMSEIIELQPRYNVAPTQSAPVVVEDSGRALKLFQWGLIPSWAKEVSIGHKMINARAETIAEKPSFRAAFKKRRCLVVADGFYEWRPLGGKGKQPLRAVLPSRESFAMAGLWESWKYPEDKELRTFTIVTTTANEVMRSIHERMPVILHREDEGAWLDPTASPEALVKLLKPWDGAIETYAVSTLVNSPKNENPALIEPKELRP